MQQGHPDVWPAEEPSSPSPQQSGTQVPRPGLQVPQGAGWPILGVPRRAQCSLGCDTAAQGLGALCWSAAVCGTISPALIALELN